MNVIIVLVLKSMYSKWEESSALQFIVVLGSFLNQVNKELSVLNVSLYSVVDAEMLTILEVVQLLRFNRHPRGKSLIASIRMLSMPVGLSLVKDMSGKYQKLVRDVVLLLIKLMDATT